MQIQVLPHIGGGGLLCDLIISSTVLNYNIRDNLISQCGWDGVSPVNCNLLITNNAIVGSSSIGQYSLDTGTMITNIFLRIDPGSYVVGKGGNGYGRASGGRQNGGPAIRISSPISIDNRGIIGGGGNGGAAGVGHPTGSNEGNGGGGAGHTIGLGGIGGPAPCGAPNAPNGTLTSGGGGGGRACCYLPPGGIGQCGTPGHAGSGLGGGAAIHNTSDIIWIHQGDVRGAIS